jgi:hypothetical protein
MNITSPRKVGASPNTAPGDRRPRSVALDVLAFSNALPAGLAGALTIAAGQALSTPAPLRWAMAAASGGVVIYGFDRLRDQALDRRTSPLRTAFVVRHARALWISIAVAACVLLATLWGAPAAAAGLYVGVGTIGLLHRRLKHLAGLKTLYVSLAWTVATAGAPYLAGGAGPVLDIGAIFFASVAANLIASNLRDDEAPLLLSPPIRALLLARIMAAAGVALALGAPAPLTPFVWIPAAEFGALAFFRPTERYGHLAVDGALLAGALVTLIHQAIT